MNIRIAGRHMEVTDALRDYVEDRIARIGERFGDRIIDAHVVLAVEKYRHQAEVTFHANGMRVHGKEESEDMYASIDKVLERLERRCNKYKARIVRHKPRSHKEALSFQFDVVSRPEEVSEEEEEPTHDVVTTEKVAVRELAVNEAITQLELIDEDFLVFKNSDTGQINVLHHRKDGQYGLIQVEPTQAADRGAA